MRIINWILSKFSKKKEVKSAEPIPEPETIPVPKLRPKAPPKAKKKATPRSPKKKHRRGVVFTPAKQVNRGVPRRKIKK